jgi:sensor histidine kinase YesM
VNPALPHQFSWSRLLRHGVQNLALNTLIAALLWSGSSRKDFDVQWVYSEGIGLSIWLIIDLGRFVVDRNSPIGWPRGWRGLALVAFGIVAGFLLGILIGDTYAQQSSWARLFANGQSAAALLLMTFAIGGVISYHYYVRGKSSYYQAELERSQRQATEAQLKLLQSQLEPHMLFNTLANLRVLIGADPQRATQMLDHVVAYLRATLDASRASTHGLAVEFERLHDYLELMAVRMGPRLQYTLDLPDELRAQPVPTLLLQPLVENAIKHGLEPCVAGGHILVRASRQGDTLVLEVSDTGEGLPDAPLQETGFGLIQVRERLATAYGAGASFDLRPHQPTGTTAAILLPIKP